MILRTLAKLLTDMPELPNGPRHRRRHPCVQALFHLKMEELLQDERPLAWRARKAWHENQRRRFTAMCTAKQMHEPTPNLDP